MMRINLPPRFRPLLFAAGGLLCVAIIYWVALQALINTDAVRERLSASLKEQTGAVLEVQQTALSVFPLPSVILRRVSIVNSTQSNESYFFEAESITFRLGLSSIFESQPKFSEVKLRKPRLSLERYSLQEANWTGFLALFKNMNGVAIDKMTVMDGLITYRDASNEQLQSLDKLQGQVQWRAGALTSARLGFSVFDTASEFSLSTSGVTISAYDHFTMQADALLRVGKDYAGYKGALAQMPGQPLIGQGSIQIEAQHARQWMERLFSAEKKLGAFAAITKDMPLHLQANLNSRADRGTLALQDLSLGESKGKVNVSWLVQPTKTQAKVEAIFEQLSIDQVLGDKDGNPSHFLTVFLPEGVEANITAQIKKMPFNQVPISDVKFTASLSDGEMNINQLLLALPGRTRGFVFGIMKRDATGGINFDGSAELIGEDAASFLTESGFGKVNLVAQAHSKFRARSAVFLSGDRGTFSELRFQGGDFYVVGGINLNPGTKNDIEMTLRFKNVHLEPLASFFAPLFATAATTDAEVLNRRLPWLNTINQRIFLNLLFEDFSLGQRKGIRSRFVASLEKDKVQFDTIEVNLEGASIRGVASFNQKDDLPLLTTQLHVSDYNLNSLFGTGHIQHPVPRGNMVPVWSSQPWETSFLRGYDSKMSIQIDRATHDSFSAKNLSFEAESTNGEWSIENIKADMWGGTLQSNVHLDVSSVPTFTTSFYLTNIRLEAFLKSLAGFEGLQGLSSLSAEISSSGISAADFVKNANGSVAFKGRDILLQGFDLASLVQTVPAVRSVADVVNTVRIATLRGFSSFSIVEGGFYFSQGALGTQGITFRSRHALGSYVGSIDLMRWIIQAAIQFKLISIATDEYPAVTVTLKDSLDQPIIDLDARSLEAWVARQKLIQ